jgi:benzoyl-CoA reductase/2-hydroxyglutaryl-CoA dehydratase subunit BcrC/BadD/HgdB
MAERDPRRGGAAGCGAGVCGAAAERYPFPLEPSPADAGLAAALAEEARATIERLAAQPGRPRAMAAFDALLGGPARLEEIRASGRPVVGTLCNFVPEELVRAASAIPVRLDLVLAAAAEAGGRALAQDVCPAVRSVLGAELSGHGLFEAASLIVVPVACDGKRALARALAARRRVFVLELPRRKDTPRARDRFVEEVRDLARELERLTGRTIGRRELRAQIALSNERTALLRELAALRQAASPPPLSGRDAFLVMHASFVADPADWIAKTRALVEELRARGGGAGGAGASAGPRILLTGSPIYFPGYKLLEVIEERGAHVVADEMCSGTQRLYHPVVVDETTVGGMVRALAERAILPCTCPCFSSGDDRIVRLLELARTSRATGVVHQTLRLCQPYDTELPVVREALRREGIPLLDLRTDGGAEDRGLLANRVEAFLEMLGEVGAAGGGREDEAAAP